MVVTTGRTNGKRSMRNGAIADVVADRARGVVSTSAETVSLAGDTDQSGPTMVPAASVTTEVVVELGESNLWATVERAGTLSRPELVKGARPGQFPADLRVTAAGRWFWGAQRIRAADVLVSNILSRADDPVPMVVAGQVIAGAEMVARQIATLVSLVKPVAPSRLTLVHPVDLSRRGRAAVESHLIRRLPADTSVRWISRAEAVVAAAPECADLAPGDRVGILHVGGSCVEAAVWKQSAPSSGDVVAMRIDRGNAGHAVDDALLTALCHGTGLGRSEARPPVNLPQLRRECERAKVALSAETAVDIDIDGVPVRMVRSDVEQLSARLLTRQLDTLGTAVSRSHEETAPLRMILLLGGATAAPSLVEAASARFDVPVIAVPRVGDTLARQTMTDATGMVRADRAAAAVTASRGAVPAPIVLRGESTAASLAQARRQWDPLISLTAVPAAASVSTPDGDDRAASAREHAALRTSSRANGAVATRSTGRTSGTAASTGVRSPLPPSFARSQAGPTRIPFPRPTHLAMAAGLLMAIAAVPAIGGAMQSADDPTTTATTNGLGSAVGAGSGGLLGGPGLVFTPGAVGPAGPSGIEWLANPTGTLGPNQLLSMAKPASSGAGPSDLPSTARRASTAGGTSPANGSMPASSSTPGGGSTPAGGSTPIGGSSPVGSTPGGGSTPASTTPPASTPAASDPPSASDPPPVTNPSASDPPPASNPEPTGESSPNSAADPAPSSAESSPAPDPSPLSTGSPDGGSAGVAESTDSATP
jgi:molecular chaperone DnaK